MTPEPDSMNELRNDKYLIKVPKNGPYLVSNGIPLIEQIIGVNAAGEAIEWREGKKYPLQDKYTLCRCGKSNSKPYCDNTHKKADFDGTETAGFELYINAAEVINGPTLKLTDVEKLCASGWFCLPSGGTWELTRQSNNPQSRELAITQVSNCPSGRLVVWDKKTGKAIEPEFAPSIGVVSDSKSGVLGPLWVRGGIPIASADGVVYEVRNRVTLCRCGKSSNKPFCDSSHID
jgi:CDGSH-type Zn-finger protein